MFPLKQIKKTEWAGIAVIFISVVLYHCWQDIQQGYTQVFLDAYYHLAYILSHQNPQLFSQDWLMQDPMVARKAFVAYPLYLSLLGAGIHQWGFFTALSVVQFGLGLIYLFCAFILLFKITGRIGLSVFLAMLSAFRTVVFPGELRGVLSVGLVMPGTVFLAFSPLLFGAWLAWQEQPVKRRWLFLAQGCLGMIHPLSWGIFTFSMLFAQWVQGCFRWAIWKEAVICGGLSAIPLLPFLLSWTQMSQEPALPEDTRMAVVQVLLFAFPQVRLSYWWTQWEQALPTLGWIVITGWATLKTWKKLPTLAGGFAIGSILLLFFFYGLNEWILLPRHQVILEGYRCLKYLFLPALVAIGIWLKPHAGFQLWWRGSLICFCTLVLNAALLWQDIQLKPLAIQTMVTNQWHALVLPISPATQAELYDLRKIAAYIKATLPIQKTLIHVSTPMLLNPARLRVLAERSITLSLFDAVTINHQNLPEWWNRGVYTDILRRQYGFCSTQEIAWVKRFKATHLLCSQLAPQPDLPVLYRSSSLILYRL